MVRPTSPKTIVSRNFFSSPRPIYLLDATGRIVFQNQAFCDWTGLTEEEVQGTVCSYSDQPSQTDWSRRLAAPPQVKETGWLRTAVSCCRDGIESIRTAFFLALEDATGSTLVIVETDDSLSVPEDVDFANLHRQVAAMRDKWQESYGLDAILGNSPAIQQVRAQVRLASESLCRFVVIGNLGIGREIIARTILSQRERRASRIIPLSCGLLDAELLQTTVQTLVKQIAELEDDDTTVLLLLEVDKLSLDAQAVLLGFLEIPEFGFETVATSQRSLFELVEQDAFRQELACHLATLEVIIPPLRERMEDIPVLAQWILEQSPSKDRVGGFTDSAMELLLRYPWHRELEELREVVEKAARNATTSTIDTGDLPQPIDHAMDAATLPEIKTESIQLDDFLNEVETEIISRALRAAKGNRAQAARSLGISRGKLLRRIEQLEIDE